MMINYPIMRLRFSGKNAWAFPTFSTHMPYRACCQVTGNQEKENQLEKYTKNIKYLE